MKLYACILLLFIGSSCTKLPIDTSLNQLSEYHPSDSTVFAMIGDYGDDTQGEADVAAMVKSWNPEFVITTGDNNYVLGSAGTINNNIGKYYGDFIYNPDAPPAMRCTGRATEDKRNRFFPTAGNHDHYSAPSLQPYLDYFTLPGDERNYDFVWGPVHFYTINSGVSGNISCCDSRESVWLKDAISKSNEPFKFVFFHHPPYSVSNHGSSKKLRWPFNAWGIDAVLNGHDHVYERIIDNQEPSPVYVVCGNSGRRDLYGCDSNPLDATRYTVICDKDKFGAVKVKVSRTMAVFEYYTVNSPQAPSDVYIIRK